MTTEAEEIQRIISVSVRDMLDAYRIQASAGPVSDKALEEIVFRAAHGVVQSLETYPGPQRVANASERRAHAAGDLPRGRGGRGAAQRRPRMTSREDAALLALMALVAIAIVVAKLAYKEGYKRGRPTFSVSAHRQWPSETRRS